MSIYKGSDSTTSPVFVIFVLKPSYFCVDSWLKVLEPNSKNDYPKLAEIGANVTDRRHSHVRVNKPFAVPIRKGTMKEAHSFRMAT